MARDPLARMDIDTRWAYHRKCRALQAAYPTDWPSYWCAYQAVLGESWAAQERVTLRDAWVPSLPTTIDAALSALVEVGLLDKSGKVPTKSWDEWFGPAIARIDSLSERGRKGAERRWGKRAKHPNGQSLSNGPAIAQPSVSNAQAMHHASQPATPSTPASHAIAAPTIDDPDDDITTLQKLAESLTGTPYGFPRHSGMGEKVGVMVRKHGLGAVEEEWRRIAAEERGMPTVRQLVLGADNALNRISAPVVAGKRDEVAEFVAKVKAQTREEAARA